MKRIATVATQLLLMLLCSSVAFAATTAPNTMVKDATTGMEFVNVKGGCFQMGNVLNSETERDEPVHKVCLQDFFLGKYEVTQEQWKKVMGNNPTKFSKCGVNCPVENVSWEDAQEFIVKLNSLSKKNYRLPTEAEWEYAARSGGKDEEYAGGMKLDDVAWYQGNSKEKPHPVGTKKPNGLGLYDMSGNVIEWCNDWFDENYYAESPEQDPQGPKTGTQRVLRGGRWSTSIDAETLRTTKRHMAEPNSRENNIGFRLALPALPAK